MLFTGYMHTGALQVFQNLQNGYIQMLAYDRFRILSEQLGRVFAVVLLLQLSGAFPGGTRESPSTTLMKPLPIRTACYVRLERSSAHIQAAPRTWSETSDHVPNSTREHPENTLETRFCLDD